ncbi:MAG: outer membrane lipoprotein-sorting protein [Gammaproteobacteria bacterium]|nr:outer membrane lipoprotein-sorting protein [Gammaproteobacteria bacterium]MDH4314733.1 outer membrane lipoprotein-sorting protein [Gammaproteobacteria bacterium]MDH5215911.1 outer membrane lipoprotein-sorting protein [Gammaproteobacteria bacterium]MDH5501118.1 outer membrane lipoprotein-sorting protein [Gammaproteobacteria bacterium]
MKNFAIAVVVSLLLGTGAAAQDTADADDIVARANLAAYYSGDDGRSEVRMIISDAQGRQQRRQFTVLRRDISDGGDQQFLVVFSQPSDVRGTTFLVDKHIDSDDDRWLYLPGLDLVKRISAGDKRTSFVGAHYYYEDVSGRHPGDDVHELVETGDQHYVLRHVPKDPGSVEFASYVTWIDKTTWLPMKIEYSNASSEVYRRVEVLEVQDFQGHPTVVTSRVSDVQGGGQTDMQFRYIQYDLGLPAELFSERSLRNPPRQWLERAAD